MWAALLGLALLTSGLSASPAAAAGTSEAWVAVSVATVWRSPSAPRPVDRASLAVPVRLRGWLARMSTSDRRALAGRADTQALMGDRVMVVGRRGTWARIVVPDQPTPLDRRGYPGWVPVAQLTTRRPSSVVRVTVVRPTTWLRTDDAHQSAALEISYGTSLPVAGRSGGWIRTTTPTGRPLRVSAAAVTTDAPGAGVLSAERRRLVNSAQLFTGLAYLWAGRSGFGLDCSGLTSLVYRVHGITLARDADAQARSGRAVATPGPGDLMFYATGGHVHHVAMYAGNGLMVQAPRTGVPVQTIAVRTPSYARELTAVRQLLP